MGYVCGVDGFDHGMIEISRGRTLVLVPAFNEEGSIGAVIQDLRMNVPDAAVIVINDGSTDATSRITRSQGVRVVDVPFNLGIGAAVQTGLLIADRECCDAAVQFDGDGQHLGVEIGRLLDQILDGADLVIGSRFLADTDYSMPIARSIGARIFSSMISAIVGQRITDTTSGFRAYGKKTIALFSRNYPDDYPEVEALILARQNGLKIREVPVRMRERSAGKSSITPVRAVYYMAKVLLAIGIALIRKA